MNSISGNDKAFLNRLISIIGTNMGDEQFGVSELAKEAGLNRSQLYIRVKSLTNKSVSQFIREIRLSKALELLQQTEMNVSEIAYNVGFSSPAYFNKCFHDQFGYPPGEAKNYAEVQSDSAEYLKELKPIIIKAARQPSKLILVAIAMVVLLGAYLAYHTFSNNPSKKAPIITTKSIAVLPLKNLSNHPEIQYLADGIMEDILSRLSHVDGLVVKSRISSEKIGNENLTAKEIAKELNVDYFLEGSIIPENNKIRVNVQLISAKEDKHVWANHFNKDLAGIIPFITDVSTQITDELEIALTSDQKEHLEKHYTENREAYNYYLEGCYYHRLRTKASFAKSIEFHQKALELDSNYCLAYAGLADVFVTSTYFGYYPREEGILKSRAYALKALSIDKNLAEAHATLGAIATYFDYDWAKAEKELKLAIKINPQYPRANHLYAQYLMVAGRTKEAENYIGKAIELNPQDKQLLWFNYYLYLREGKYDKALEVSEKMSFKNQSENEGNHRMNFRVYLRQESIIKAIENYKRYLSDNSPGINTGVLDSIYSKDGKNGIVRYVIDYGLQNNMSYGEIAEYYAIINEKDLALQYLERDFENVGGTVRTISDPVFNIIRSEPRFKELLKKMNLSLD